MATNHISHFSLTLRLLPLLRKTAATSPEGARIVNVSSHLHFLSQLRANDMHFMKSFSSQTAYANSKCAQVLTTRLLRQQLSGSGVEAFAVHPGIVRTSITRSLPTLLQNGQDLIKFLHFTPEEGTIFYAHCRPHNRIRSCCCEHFPEQVPGVLSTVPPLTKPLMKHLRAGDTSVRTASHSSQERKQEVKH